MRERYFYRKYFQIFLYNEMQGVVCYLEDALRGNEDVLGLS
jgi:hypothetical protein